MSAIDTVYHEVIGQIDGIPIYRLLEDAPKQSSKDHGFDGKKGDILLGGGSGEASAMRISMPEYIEWQTTTDIDTMFKYNLYDLIHTHWSNENAYHFIKRYIELGYDIDYSPIETWLGEHIVSYLLKHFRDDYKNHIGNKKKEAFDFDGSICDKPEKEWVEFNKQWFQNRKG